MSAERAGIERVWGHSVWSWRLQAVFALACLLLLVSSQTASGRIFAMMLLVAQAFASWCVAIARARARGTDRSGDDEAPHPL
jgi:hypothetical protein